MKEKMVHLGKTRLNARIQVQFVLCIFVYEILNYAERKLNAIMGENWKFLSVLWRVKWKKN